jgi:hypothetical protein
VDETREQIARESVSEQQRFSEAALVDGKKLKRLARFEAETTFSRRRLPAGRAVGLLGHGKPTPATTDAFRRGRGAKGSAGASTVFRAIYYFSLTAQPQLE